MVANRPQTLLPMSTANISNKSLRKTVNLRISEDCISHCILYSLKWNSAMLAWCQLLLSSSTDDHIFKHGFQISKHVRACRHVKLGPESWPGKPHKLRFPCHTVYVLCRQWEVCLWWLCQLLQTAVSFWERDWWLWKFEFFSSGRAWRKVT